MQNDRQKKISCSSCDPDLSVHDNVNHHQDNTWSACEHLHPHWITVSCHGVEGPMTSGYYCAIFPFCGGGKKKKRRQKNKGLLWLDHHRYPSNKSIPKVISHNKINIGYYNYNQPQLVDGSNQSPILEYRQEKKFPWILYLSLFKFIYRSYFTNLQN